MMTTDKELLKRIDELEKIIDPYMKHCKLVNDAPKEAKEAFEKLKEIAWDQEQ